VLSFSLALPASHLAFRTGGPFAFEHDFSDPWIVGHTVSECEESLFRGPEAPIVRTAKDQDS